MLSMCSVAIVRTLPANTLVLRSFKPEPVYNRRLNPVQSEPAVAQQQVPIGKCWLLNAVATMFADAFAGGPVRRVPPPLPHPHSVNPVLAPWGYARARCRHPAPAD